MMEPTHLTAPTDLPAPRTADLAEAKQAAYRALHNIAALEAHPADVDTLAPACRAALADTIAALTALEDRDVARVALNGAIIDAADHLARGVQPGTERA